MHACFLQMYITALLSILCRAGFACCMWDASPAPIRLEQGLLGHISSVRGTLGSLPDQELTYWQYLLLGGASPRPSDAINSSAGCPTLRGPWQLGLWLIIVENFQAGLERWGNFAYVDITWGCSTCALKQFKSNSQMRWRLCSDDVFYSQWLGICAGGLQHVGICLQKWHIYVGRMAFIFP